MKMKSFKDGVELSCCDKFHMIMLMHFPDVEPNAIEELSCFRCTDFKCGACKGELLYGQKVIECMVDKVSKSSHWEWGSMGFN